MAALKGIARFGSAAAPAAACRLADSELTVRAEAETLLESCDDVSSAAINLGRLLEHESIDVRKKAIGWLGECGEEAAYFASDIVKSLTHSDTELSKEAIVQRKQTNKTNEVIIVRA